MINASQYSQLNCITSMGNCDHLLDPCTERLITVTSDCETDQLIPSKSGTIKYLQTETCEGPTLNANSPDCKYVSVINSSIIYSRERSFRKLYWKQTTISISEEEKLKSENSMEMRISSHPYPPIYRQPHCVCSAYLSLSYCKDGRQRGLLFILIQSCLNIVLRYFETKLRQTWRMCHMFNFKLEATTMSHDTSTRKHQLL